MSRRKRQDSGATGLALVDKPAGWTSHDVVAKARGVFGTRKVGHSGTLDPDATGVLLLGVGKATKLLRFLDGLPKAYTAEIVFGTETDTLDASGSVVASYEMAVDIDSARTAASRLTGDIMQVPPMVSAKKIGGKKLYELAREGIEVEREAVAITVHHFDLDETSENNVVRCSVECSTGTFIRSLAADLGHLLGGGAHLRNLRRTAIGDFDVADCAPLDEVELRPMVDIVGHLGPVTVDDELVVDIGYGRVLDAERVGVTGAGPFPILDPSGQLIAIYEKFRGASVKPSLVLVQPPTNEAERTS